MFTFVSTLLTRTKTAVAAFAVAVLPGIALDQAQPATTFDKDGTLQIGAYQLPQSELDSNSKSVRAASDRFAVLADAGPFSQRP